MMTTNYEEYVSPYWAGFRRIWWIVAVILSILLLLLWLKGYGPGGTSCAIPVEKPAEKVATLVVPEIESQIDNIGPTITLMDASPIYLTAGDNFTDPGATAVDNIDGDVTVTISGNIDTNTPGEYELTYSATDKAGNTTSETRLFTVKAARDSERPVITLNESSTLRILQGTNYSDPGATAIDKTDGEVSVTTTGVIDTNTPGDYTLTYTAQDKAGNTTSRTRTIIVAVAPQLAKTNSAESVSETTTLPKARLYFDYDVDSNPSDRDNSLAGVISYLKVHSDATAVVSGYHDPTGNIEHNQDLAKRRAETVIGLLINAGISTKQLLMDKPAETTGSGTPEEARRVEVKIDP